MSSPRQEHQPFPRQEHQEIEKTFNNLHISGNTGKTVLTHNPKPQYQQQPTHNEPRQRSSPEPKNRNPFGHVVRHNYPSHYQDNHATDIQRTDYDPITRYQTDIRQNDQQMKHTTAYYADNENTTSQTTTPKIHPRTTQVTFQRYRDVPNTSVMSHSTTTSRTNENNQTQIYKPHVTLQKPRLLAQSDTNQNARQHHGQYENITKHQRLTHAEIHTHPRLQQTQRMPTQQKPLIDLGTLSQEPINTPHELQANRGKIHQSFRTANALRQRAREELKSILQNDKHVQDLNRRPARRYTSSSDSETEQDYYNRHHRVYTQKANELPRHKSPIPSPKSKRHKGEQQSSHQTENATQTGQERKGNTHKFKLTYDNDSLLCEGQGWIDQFMRRTDNYYPEPNQPCPRRSNKTTIDTNNPFLDLQINLATEPKTNQKQNEIQTEDTTISSTQSLQIPLTSTPNDSMHQLDIPMSPTLTYNNKQIAPETTSINKISQIPSENGTATNEKTEDTLENSPHTNYDTIETLQVDTITPDETNETFKQIDGNTTFAETGADTQEIDLDGNTTFAETGAAAQNMDYDGNTTFAETNKIIQKTDNHPNKRNTRNDQIEQHIASQLKNIDESTQREKYLAKRRILQNASDQYTPNETTPAVMRRVTRHLNQTEKFSEQIEQEHQEETNSKKQHINPKTNSTLKTSKQTDYNDPEATRQIVERDRQIKKDISDYDKMESEHQKSKIKQQIEQTILTLNSLNMQLTAQEQHTDTSDNEEYDHTDEEEDNNIEHDSPSDTEQDEETENQPIIPINIITISEFNEMESKLSHNSREKFDMTKEHYQQTKLNIANSAMRLTEKIEADDNSPQHYDQTQQEREHLINLRIKEIQLEEKLHNIAKAGGKNNLNIIMPQFGTNMGDCRQWKSIPNFNPKHEDALPFNTVWTLIIAKGQRDNLCEEAYKDILENILKGKALQYYTAHSSQPLKEIIESLFNAFVTTKTRQQLRININNFKAEKNQNFRQTLEGLKLLVREYYKHLPPGTRDLEEDAEIRRCITEQKLANPNAIAHVLRKQQETQYDGTPFNFLEELVREDDILQEAGNPYSQNGQANTLAIYTTATQNEPTSRPNNAEPRRIHLGNTGQHGISAKPKEPSEEKIKRMFRHSDRGFRPRSNSPNSARSRQNSPSPHRPTSPHITESTQRDNESRQRSSRDSELNKRRFANQPRQGTNQPENNFRPQRPQTRQHSTESQPRYSQYTNNDIPQKHRSSSVTPQYRKNNSYQSRKSNTPYNNTNFTPIGSQRKPYTYDNNRQFQQNQPRYQSDRQQRSYSPGPSYQKQNYDTQNFTRTNNQHQNAYQPKYGQKQYNNYSQNRGSIFDEGIVTHKMTYYGDKNQGGRLNQEFSFAGKCRKTECQDDQDHAYQNCPRRKSFQPRH